MRYFALSSGKDYIIITSVVSPKQNGFSYILLLEASVTTTFLEDCKAVCIKNLKMAMHLTSVIKFFRILNNMGN